MFRFNLEIQIQIKHIYAKMATGTTLTGSLNDQVISFI